MLSRVAERVYWTGRYIERVENTARLVQVYAALLLDMPDDVRLGWYNLVALNGAEADFDARYTERDEASVVRFLIGDRDNPMSMVSSLAAVRENIRTTRDVVPAASWELANQLSLYVATHLEAGIQRRERQGFLDWIIGRCQHLNGLLIGTMCRDAAWEFMVLGRNLERADMTTRILDAGAVAVASLAEDEMAGSSRQIVWGSVLRSLDAAQSYRRTVRRAVKGHLVARFLLEDPHFPRTLNHCLNRMLHAASNLPRRGAIVDLLEAILNEGFDGIDYKQLGSEFRDVLNDLQIGLGRAHQQIQAVWFADQSA
ncbi:MAG: alpha-E domain-containing protein [Pseudomonadota bacterium]